MPGSLSLRCCNNSRCRSGVNFGSFDIYYSLRKGWESNPHGFSRNPNCFQSSGHRQLACLSSGGEMRSRTPTDSRQYTSFRGWLSSSRQISPIQLFRFVDLFFFTFLFPKSKFPTSIHFFIGYLLLSSSATFTAHNFSLALTASYALEPIFL